MRLILIVIATLLCCTIVNAKNESREKVNQKKPFQNQVDGKKCREESCDYKKVDKYKDGEDGKSFRWNKNFKNHKNNIYDNGKKNTESVYRPKYKKAREEDVVEVKKYVKKNKKNDRDSGDESTKKKKQRDKFDDSGSSETNESIDENSKETSKEVQCDSSEKTCKVK